MSLTLSSAQALDFAEMSRTLLSPLTFSDPQAWAAAVQRTARSLFGTDLLVLGIPEQARLIQDFHDPGVLLLGGGEHVARFAEIPPIVAQIAENPRVDPVFHAWIVEKWRRGLIVESDAIIEQVTGRPLGRSMVYNEILVEAGMPRFWGLHAGTPAGQVLLILGYGAADANPHGQHLALLLPMLLPSLQAGVVSLRHREMLDAGLRRSIDAQALPVLVYDAGGRELHRNRALLELLALAPDPAALVNLAHGIAAETAGAMRGAGGRVAPFGTREARLGGGTFRLTASWAGGGAGEAEQMLLILVERIGPAGLEPFFPPELLYDLYGMTRRESEVACLLAQSLTAREVAERLHVSIHTVRHHTEHIYQKLGVCRRSDLALRLRSRSVPALD